ncbi:MAG: InlB B-repeat-containing protein [Oscillospiraceae bacterium]|nr:InlB B-repeat-containing protein [Oscillospiraceae bacterium]
MKKFLTTFTALVAILFSAGFTTVVDDTIAATPANAQVSVNSWAELNQAIASVSPGGSATIVLTQNIPAQGHDAISIPAGQNITLTSAQEERFTLMQSTAGQRHFIVRGALTLKNIIISGNRENISSHHGGIEVVTNTAQLTMSEGSVIKRNHAVSGGGIYMYGLSGVGGGRGGVLTINDGKIYDNEADQGGAAFVAAGDILLHNGEISSNTANTGAGFYVAAGGHFIMDGGEISRNEATHSGGGIFTTGGQTIFQMSGGQIHNNRAGSHGGGVQAQGASSFLMERGTIHGNGAHENGGGVGVIGINSSFDMKGGSIHDNRAGNGGGVQSWGAGTFTMHSGEICDNNARVNGGGVNVIGVNSTFKLESGEIHGNSANNSGGVHVANTALFTMMNGELRNNSANLNGGGVHIAGPANGGRFIMEGGRINGNTAHGTGVSNGGGGVSILIGEFTMHGGEISNNNAARDGGGVWRGTDDRAYFVMYNGNISDNTAEDDGGGIYAAGEVYKNPLTIDSYPRIIVGAEAIFSGNSAGNGIFSPPDATAIQDRIQSKFTTVFHNPFNNIDINFRLGPRISQLTITYTTDERGTFAGEGDSHLRTEVIQVDIQPFPWHPQNVPTAIGARGHEFIGWLEYAGSDDLLSNQQVKEKAITSDTTFVAQWERVAHTVSFILNGGTGDFPPQTLPHEATATEPLNIPIREGWRFLGWHTAPEGGVHFDFTTPIISDTEIYARWEQATATPPAYSEIPETPPADNISNPTAPTNPPTGDDSFPIIQLAAIILSFVLMSLMILGRKRKRSKVA